MLTAPKSHKANGMEYMNFGIQTYTYIRTHTFTHDGRKMFCVVVVSKTNTNNRHENNFSGFKQCIQHWKIFYLWALIKIIYIFIQCFTTWVLLAVPGEEKIIVDSIVSSASSCYTHVFSFTFCFHFFLLNGGKGRGIIVLTCIQHSCRLFLWPYGSTYSNVAK